MKKICKLCNNEFITNRSKRIFCSNKCHGLSLHKFIKCKYCFLEYRARDNKSKFCSQKCYFSSKSKEKTHSSCEICKSSFSHPFWSKRIFCSRECQYKRGKDLKKYRAKALSYYGHKCKACNLERKTVDIHHIDRNRTNNVLDNLIPLCRACHIRLHSIIDKLPISPSDCLDIFINSDLPLLKPGTLYRLFKKSNV